MGDCFVETNNAVSKEEQVSVSTYHNESGYLYAEDVDQHVAVPLEVTASTTRITIDN